MKKELLILKNYILYFLVFIVVLFYGVSHPLAWTSDGGITYEGIAYLTDSTTISIQADYDTPEGLILELEPNQTYYTRIKKLFIDVDGYNFIGGRQYQLELHFEGIQLNNNANTYKAYAWNTSTNALDLCQTSYDETIMSNDAYPRWNFQCPSTTTEIVIHVYNSNDSAITTTGNFRWSYSYLWYTNQSMGSGNDSIIDNSNQNADRIIDNQNENTNKILDSQKVCISYNKDNIKDDGKLLTISGGTSNSNNWGITDYINIYKSDVTIDRYNFSTSASTCFYDELKNLISCVNNQQLNDDSIPNNSYYMRLSILKSNNLPRSTVCKAGNQALNDSINDDSVDTSQASDFFSSFNDNTHGLSGIISAPLNAINSMLSNTCTDLSATWKGQTVSLPCGTTFWIKFATIKEFLNITLDGLICYRILIKLFQMIEKIKNPNDDRVEVMDL